MNHHPQPPAKRLPTLHRKKNGYYYILFYNPQRQSKLKWKALGTKDLKQANLEFARISTEYFQGYDPWTNKQKSTVSEAVASFIGYKRRLLKKGSIRSIKEVLMPFSDLFAERILSSLSDKEILEYTIKKDYSANTNKRRAVTMRSFLSWADEQHGPVTKIKWPRIRIPKNPGRFLSRDEYQLIDNTFSH